MKLRTVNNAKKIAIIENLMKNSNKGTTEEGKTNYSNLPRLDKYVNKT